MQTGEAKEIYRSDNLWFSTCEFIYSAFSLSVLSSLLTLLMLCFTLLSGRLLRDKTQGSPMTLQKISQLAKSVELALYRDAPSFEIYNDIYTLNRRLHKLNVEYSRTNHQRQDNSSQRESGQYVDQQERAFSSMSSYGDSDAPIACDDEDPLHKRRRLTSSGTAATGSTTSDPQQPRSSSIADIFIAHNILQQQQRLLLLQHAASCRKEDGCCTATKHCAQVKRLWNHMERCSNDKCTQQHCYSSRILLTHYKRCQDARCRSCGPVRQVVLNDGDSSQTSPSTLGA